MYLTRRIKNKNTIYLKIDGISFKQVNFFKYLRVSYARGDKTTPKALKSANKAYFAIDALFEPKILSQKTTKKCTQNLKPILQHIGHRKQ
ncbi:Uncharacterized protein FWK35_00020526 [Aphis craccivora]|uniref:Uncharacterized protein n=1 Tax=Aphis craccivora TaxID=307492 RepID=A0A6G0Z854_APHCR|nr:Uncharacterized protein FWK35_00020526 [Aphis craccivora]